MAAATVSFAATPQANRPIPANDYTRGLMTNLTAQAAREYLGIIQQPGPGTNTIVIVTGTNTVTTNYVVIVAGAATNLLAADSIATLKTYEAATNIAAVVTATDGTGGYFVSAPTFAGTYDEGIFIEPDAGGGAWARVYDNNVFPVRWWGATVTNSTVQAAVDFAANNGGGRPLIPGGNHPWNGEVPITLGNNVLLEGEPGAQLTVDNTSFAGDYLVIDARATTNAGVAGLTIIGNPVNGSGTGYGIDFSGSVGFTVENCIVDSCSTGPFVTTSASEYVIKDLVSIINGYGTPAGLTNYGKSTMYFDLSPANTNGVWYESVANCGTCWVLMGGVLSTNGTSFSGVADGIIYSTDGANLVNSFGLKYTISGADRAFQLGIDTEGYQYHFANATRSASTWFGVDGSTINVATGDGNVSLGMTDIDGRAGVLFQPTISDGEVPFTFNTKVTHTSSNLVNFWNHDALKAYIDFNGNYYPGGSSVPAITGAGASGQLPLWNGASSLTGNSRFTYQDGGGVSAEIVTNNTTAASTRTSQDGSITMFSGQQGSENLAGGLYVAGTLSLRPTNNLVSINTPTNNITTSGPDGVYTNNATGAAGASWVVKDGTGASATLNVSGAGGTAGVISSSSRVDLVNSSASISLVGTKLLSFGGNLELGDASHPAVKFYLSKSIAAPGTTGNQTQNTPVGRVNFAAGSNTLAVANSMVTTNTAVWAQVNTVDGTPKFVVATPQTGQILLTLNAAAVGELAVSWWIDP